MSRNHCGSEQIGGAGIGSHPGSTHQHTWLLIQGPGKVNDRGTCGQRIAPVFSGEAFRTAEKCEVDMLERFLIDGLDEGDLVSDLVELSKSVVLIEKRKCGRRQ